MIYFLAGPSNIKITGPDILSSGVTSNFSCSADCYPSCSYTWTISSEAQSTVTTKYGQTISVTPDPWEIAEELICEAQDTVSLLYISTYVTPYVAREWNLSFFSTLEWSIEVTLDNYYFIMLVIYSV
jgi:hypothetical protein